MSRVPLFVELCAGTAAVSLRLQFAKAKPPISRMGSKVGFADAVLRVLGLRPGQGAERFLWCDPDDGVRLLLHSYADSELAAKAAATLDSWLSRDPRELWDQLRAEGPVIAPESPTPTELARWLYLARTAYGRMPEAVGKVYDNDLARGRRAPTVALSESMGRRVHIQQANVCRDGRIDPREYARWLTIVSGNKMIPIAYDPSKGKWVNASPKSGGISYNKMDRVNPRPDSSRVGEERQLSGVTFADARKVSPQNIAESLSGDDSLPEGTIAYIDPPYVNTAGYLDDLSRKDVVKMAKEWSDAGAIVAISEAEPIGELVGEGWNKQEITWARKGSARTFSRQQSEWITINTTPHHPGRPTKGLLRRKRL